MEASVWLVGCACLLLGAPSAARLGQSESPAATTWYVDDDACPGPGSGTRAVPFCSIQAAINAAASGDLVLVAPGTYPERIDFLGKAIRVVASEGPTVTELYSPPLSGIDVGAVFQNGEQPDSVLDGFTIRGHSSGTEGAVQCTGSAPTIVRNVIRLNTSSAISCTNSLGVRILSNLIYGNSLISAGGTGAGIYAFGSTMTVAGNVIQQNYLDSFNGFGAGVYLDGCSATFASNAIVGNWCDYDGGGGYNLGGGLYCQFSTVTIKSSTFSRNIAGAALFTPGRGGAIASLSSQLSITNTILWNDVTYSGNPMSEAPELFVQGGFAHVDHSDVDGGRADLLVLGAAVLEWGDGNVELDPAFVDPTGYDFHLAAGSPAIDAGRRNEARGGTDAYGDPRILDGTGNQAERIDIGADEFDFTVLTADVPATLGGTVTLTTTAPFGWNYLLALSTGPGDIPLPPYGSALIDVGGIVVFLSGAIPGSDGIPIPPLVGLAGLEIWGQSLSLDPMTGAGASSNVVRMVLH